MMTRMTVPPSAETVAEAARWLLEPTGYHLATTRAGCPPEAEEIARKPVSPLGLKPQLTTIERALILVGGSRTRLVIDDRARAVCYGWTAPV